MARVPAEATAFAHRNSRIMVNVAAFYEGPKDRAVREAYPGSTWERLAAIKARYDPTNLFRLNQKHPARDQGSKDRADIRRFCERQLTC